MTQMLQISDREKTEFLTKLGFLFLKKMGCYAISTEVHMPIHNRIADENDAHFTIDILGISKKYIPYNQQKKTKDAFGLDKTIKWNNVLRGVEVKVSRSDFKNGFIHTGCHFNYLLIPKGLVIPSEVHSSVGIIEVDLENASVKKPFFSTMQNQGFCLTGIELRRRPKRKQIEDYLINMAFDAIGETLTLQAKRWLVGSLAINGNKAIEVEKA
ncbi:MAG: hypothetical protein WC325_13370 [Candidatus Bathyarchaeia archaeon]|jgi:hypothetical protein